MATNIGTLMATIGVDTKPLKKAEDQTRRSTGRMASDWKSLAKSVAATAIAFTGVATAVRGMSQVFKDGFNSVENMRLSAASLASTITSFAKGAEFDLAGTYKQAYDYSTQLVLKMEEWNAKTVATGANLSAMVETLAQSGIVLDLNNKEQEKGFLAIANALALITQGQNQDIQFRQEIRGLAQGEVRATNLLARLLEQRVGGELKKHVTLWKQQGTLIENAGALLEGFQEGAKDLQNTWLAVGTTLETMYHRILRGMFTPVYEDIIRMGRDITINVMDQNSQANILGETLRTVVYKGWQDIKNITESVVDIIESMEAPLRLTGSLVGTIFDGWGMIFAILPAITERIKLIVQAMFDVVRAIARVGDAMWNLASFNLDLAKQSFEMAKEAWYESGNKTAEAFSDGFLDEVEQRLSEYTKDLTAPIIEPVLAPEMKAYRGLSKEEKLALERNFNADYANIIKTRWDLERDKVKELEALYKEAGFEKIKIAETISDKLKVISEDEKHWKAEESFAMKMSEVEQARLNEKYELEKEINAKIRGELLSDTEFKLQQLDAQFLAYDSLIKDKATLDQWYISEYKKITEADEGYIERLALEEKLKKERLALEEEFNEEYAKIGKTRFDIERMEVERMAQIYGQAGIDKVKIAQLTSDKMKAISKAETEYKISQIHSTVSMMTRGFEQISEMGGKHSKEAFMSYKAFKIIEATIATRSAAIKAYESMGHPVAGAIAAGFAVAFGMAQVAAISSMTPPSYDKGGISRAGGIYQTGNIDEAHIPLESGGTIPVRFDSKSQEQQEEARQPINIINVTDPSQIDTYLASAQGQDAILNVLSARNQSARRILR